MLRVENDLNKSSLPYICLRYFVPGGGSKPIITRLFNVGAACEITKSYGQYIGLDRTVLFLLSLFLPNISSLIRLRSFLVQEERKLWIRHYS